MLYSLPVLAKKPAIQLTLFIEIIIDCEAQFPYLVLETNWLHLL